MDLPAQIAHWLASAQRAVAFSGAGLSTESGLPDFRSPGGIWATSQPVYYQDFLGSAAARWEYWRQKSIAHRDFLLCSPNIAHRTLAQWESQGRLCGVITQNIDEYHTEAGSQNVVELHGTARKIKCLDCETLFDANALVTEFLQTNQVPSCAHCGGFLKHATISFGQSLDATVLAKAVKLSQEADLYFVLGSSLVVHPAASLPQLAQRAGAKLIIINRDVTPLDNIADVVLHESLGETLSKIDAALADITKANQAG
ncbi:MAG TPA: Sir2 family NAD-dependent protein deacetylase [Pirellulaceae bacterium]|nr:Sir2 family NAD-dependent protein deacetylase [Pirellulaceae bacterium]